MSPIRRRRIVRESAWSRLTCSAVISVMRVAKRKLRPTKRSPSISWERKLCPWPLGPVQRTRTLETGTPVLRDAPTLNRELARTAAALRRFNDNRAVRSGLARLTQTTDIFGPAVRFIAPAQTVCNYATLATRNLASLLSQGADGGKWQRFTVFDPPEGPNDEGGYATGPANGGGEVTNFLHFNPYPNTASPGQPRECEAGNEPFKVGRQVIGNVPGNQGTVTDAQPGAKSPSASDEAADEGGSGQ